MPWLAVLIATVAAAPAAATPPGGSAATGASRVAEVLDRLRSSDPASVERATDELGKLAESGLGADDAARLLRAATGKFPKPRGDRFPAPQLLVRAAGQRPTAALVPVVEEVYARLSGGARTEALLLLMRLEERAAAETAVSLLRADRAARGSTVVRTDPLQREPRHAEVYFPALLELADAQSLFEVYAALLAACEAGALPPSRLAALAPRSLAEWKPLGERVRAAQARRAPGWPWDGEAQQVREEAGLLLDVLGYVPTEDARAELRAALALEDPKLAYFAAVGLLRSGGQVPAAVLERIAASAEVRNWLYGRLAKLGKADLFPARWRTQQAFAESELVIWLIFPTELGRPPDDIELVRVVSEKVFPEGFYDWYLFKFRTREPHWSAKRGWTAGVAGPFKRADAPSIDAYGDTFSAFERWDAASPDEHVRAVRAQIAEWRKRRSRE